MGNSLLKTHLIVRLRSFCYLLFIRIQPEFQSWVHSLAHLQYEYFI